MRSPATVVGEMWSSAVNFDISRLSYFGRAWGGLRTMIGSVFGTTLTPNTKVDMAKARAMYRNEIDELKYATGFVAPIINLCAGYIGLPVASGTDDDAFLNECIRDYWAAGLVQMYRDATRDSKTVVRFVQPSITNKLATADDKRHGRIELWPPELCDIQYDPLDRYTVMQATFLHKVEVDQRTDAEIAQGQAPRYLTQTLMEIMSATQTIWFNKDTDAQLESWTTTNRYGFVNVVEVFNEYETDLNGGQSDLEAVMPFLTAFHQVMSDTLAAHRYHSIPKATFNVKNVGQFIRNNWPDVIDPETNKPKSGAQIDWKGHEILFMSPDEEANFLEVTSIVGDSKTLLAFLLDCIAVAAESPKWSLAQDDSAIATTPSTESFEKKIGRKRVMFEPYIKVLCKMALVSLSKSPQTPRLTWQDVRLTDFAARAQAAQQIGMFLDVAAQHGWVADPTSVAIIASLFPQLNAPDIEMALAEANIQPAIAAPAPASSTQGNQGAGQS